MPSLLLNVLVSAALGAVIGLMQQGRHHVRENRPTEFSGLRTFTLWCVGGCMAAHLSETVSSWILPAVLAAVAADFVVGSRRERRPTGGSTTLIAAVVTVLIGALVAGGQEQVAIIAAAITAVLLAAKRPIHAWTHCFTEDDLRTAIQFVAITGIILPLVPNQDLGPFHAFNPFKVWLMVVIISGVGALGYALMRLLNGRGGMFWSGLLGGLASSTATTLAYARRSRDTDSDCAGCIMAVALASLALVPRVLVTISFVNPGLLPSLAVPMGAMALWLGSAAGWYWFRQQRPGTSEPTPPITNPLALGTAIKFAAIFALIAFVVKATHEKGLLEHGLLPLSFLSGLTDVDAISLSLAGDSKSGGLSPALAARGIAVAVAANSVLKAGISALGGRGRFRFHAAALLGTAAIVTGAAALFVPES
jgi:uncharacterized membrane protein (DUF4010 family)